MAESPAVETVLRCYPQIYFACHMRHVRDAKTKRILSAQRASILDHLDAVEGTGVLDLARHMGVTASTMSINLARLEAAGYVVRERDTEDSRKVQVRLTSAGTRIKQQQKVLDPGRIQTMLDQLTPREQQRALAGLELLALAAKRLFSK